MSYAGGNSAVSQQHYRDRIAAFYRHYAPEKPMSHVDFLLTKYHGHEEDVIEVLKEKFGPEPTGDDRQPKEDFTRVERMLRPQVGDLAGPSTKDLLSQYKGMEESLMHELVGMHGVEQHARVASASSPIPRGGRATGGGSQSHHAEEGTKRLIVPMSLGTDDEFDSALKRRKQQFDADMLALSKDRAQNEALETMHAISEAKLLVQRQDVEIQQLRLTTSSMQMQQTANAANFGDQIKRLAQQLTQAKLKHLALASMRNPQVVSLSTFEEVVAETAEAERELERSQEHFKKLSEVVQRHLKLYPLSPMHATLRQMDPALSARLEQ